MLIESALFVLGLVALIAGAELLVGGASRLAAAAGVSPLIIGLTVVAFGTSAPEGTVSVGAALAGRPDLAMGNIVGSNIFNLLFILGLTALIAPLTVQRQLIRKEVPIMIGVSLLLTYLIFDGVLSRLEAAGLFALLLCYTAYLVWQARRDHGESITPESTHAPDGFLSRVPAFVLVLTGLALLFLGGNWLVDSASAFARYLGISELVIGLTVVALGTSLPEAATCIIAVMRGETDIAVGNIVGSNLFNILGGLGLAGMVSPVGLTAAPALLNFDIWVMVAAAVVCLPIIFTGREISRWEGALMFGYCLAYLLYTFLAATHHDALPVFSNVMLAFIVPLSALVLLTSLAGSLKARSAR